MSSFFVIARNSSFIYKDRVVDVRQVGRELGARYVLEGSVRKAGNRLRIIGQLVDADTGNHIWANRYDGALEDVFHLQDSITSSVVAVISPKVMQAEITRAQANRPSLTAYDLSERSLLPERG
jgi:TolB-like protein